MSDLQILRWSFPEKPRGYDRGGFQREDAGAGWRQSQGKRQLVPEENRAVNCGFIGAPFFDTKNRSLTAPHDAVLNI